MPPPAAPPEQQGMLAGDMPPAAGAAARPATPVIEPQVERITAERPIAPVPTPKTASPAFNALDWDVVERTPIQPSAKAEAKPASTPAPAKTTPKFHPYESKVRQLADASAIKDPRFTALAIGVLKSESSAEDPLKVSPAFAAGPMQMTVDTFKRFRPDAKDFDINDEKQTVPAAVDYLAFLWRRYDGDPAKVAAAYNAGEGRVDKGGALPAETQKYVPKVLAHMNDALGQPPPAPPPVATAAAPNSPPQPYREPDILPPSAAPAAKVVQSPVKTPEQAQQMAANQKEISRILNSQLNPVGIGEVAVEGLTGLLAAAPAAVSAMMLAIERKDAGAFSDAFSAARDAWTTHAHTDSGKQLSKNVGQAFAMLGKVGEWLADPNIMSVTDPETGAQLNAVTEGAHAPNPVMAALFRSLPEILPLLPALKGGARPGETTVTAPEVVVPGRIEPSATIPREMPLGRAEPVLATEPAAASLERPGEPSLAPREAASAMDARSALYERRQREAQVELERRLAERRAAVPDVPPLPEPIAPQEAPEVVQAPLGRGEVEPAPPPAIDWQRARAAAQDAARPGQRTLPMDAPAVPRPLELTPPLAPRLPAPIQPEAAPVLAPALPESAPLPEPPTPPLPLKRGGVKFEDERLQTDGTTETLRAMAARAGWAEQGGRLLRDPDGVVIGRTKWMPTEPWFAEMQRDKSTRMKPQDLRDAVEKTIRGEKVTPQQARALKYLLDENDRITQSFSQIEEEHGPLVHFRDDVLDSLHVTDLPASHANLADLALIDKARALDEDAFQRIPDQASDADFMAAVRGIIDEKSKTQEAAPSEPGTEATSPAAIAEPIRAEPVRDEPITGASSAVFNPAAPAIKPRAARKRAAPLPLRKASEYKEGDAVEVRIDGKWHPAKVRDTDADNVWVFHKFPERYDNGYSETFKASDVRPKVVASVIGGQAHKAAIAAQEKFRALDRAKTAVENPDDYFALSAKMQEAKKALAERIAALPKEGFSVSGKTHDGRVLTLNASAQRPGSWQLTRFAKDGEPWGDTQYVSKRAAVKEFLDDIDVSTLSRLE